MLQAEAGTRYPICVHGSGARPPEDCGGSWGYAELRAALADPSHDDHDRMLDWLGLERPEQWDATTFDVDAINAVL